MSTPCFDYQRYLVDKKMDLGVDSSLWDVRIAQWDESQAECSRLETPYRMSQYAQIKDWMRSPQCYSEGVQLASQKGVPFADPEHGLMLGSCCDNCSVMVTGVEIYYWQEPDADTSCLEIIGDHDGPLTDDATVLDGLYAPAQIDPFGAVVFETVTYWGCTVHISPSSQQYVTTATLTQIGDHQIKRYAYNPWELQSWSCIDATNSYKSSGVPRERSSTVSSNSTYFLEARSRSFIKVQAQTLTPTSARNQSGTVVASAVVSGTMTFISPSVYALFHSISANDGCGEEAIRSTMLSFKPGDLSTIEGLTATKPFDFRDLPCPPQSVMEKNWYKPAPGEVYRPVLAVPQQILSLAWFKRCVMEAVTVLDPPKTLGPAAAMVPKPTTSDLRTISIMPTPSVTPTKVARETAHSGDKDLVSQPASSDTAEISNPQGLHDPGRGSTNSGPNRTPTIEGLAPFEQIPESQITDTHTTSEQAIHKSSNSRDQEDDPSHGRSPHIPVTTRVASSEQIIHLDYGPAPTAQQQKVSTASRKSGRNGLPDNTSPATFPLIPLTDPPFKATQLPSTRSPKQEIVDLQSSVQGQPEVFAPAKVFSASISTTRSELQGPPLFPPKTAVEQSNIQDVSQSESTPAEQQPRHTRLPTQISNAINDQDIALPTTDGIFNAVHSTSHDSPRVEEPTEAPTASMNPVDTEKVSVLAAAEMAILKVLGLSHSDKDNSISSSVPDPLLDTGLSVEASTATAITNTLNSPDYDTRAPNTDPSTDLEDPIEATLAATSGDMPRGPSDSNVVGGELEGKIKESTSIMSSNASMERENASGLVTRSGSFEFSASSASATQKTTASAGAETDMRSDSSDTTLLPTTPLTSASPTSLTSTNTGGVGTVSETMASKGVIGKLNDKLWWSLGMVLCMIMIW